MQPKNENENVHYMLPFARFMGARPFTETAKLLYWLALAEGLVPTKPIGAEDSGASEFNRRSDAERKATYRAMLERMVAEFNDARKELLALFAEHASKYAGWKNDRMTFLNLQCEPCSLDEALVDYWRSLPLVFRASIAVPSISTKDMLAADLACRDLLKRVTAITG